MSSSDSESTWTSPSTTPSQSGPTEEQLDRLAETLTEAAEGWPESKSQDQSSENRAAHKALVRHGLKLMQTSEISWADAARARVTTACSSKETPSTDLLKTLYGDTALYQELPKAAKDFGVDGKELAETFASVTDLQSCLQSYNDTWQKSEAHDPIKAPKLWSEWLTSAADKYPTTCKFFESQEGSLLDKILATAPNDEIQRPAMERLAKAFPDSSYATQLSRMKPPPKAKASEESKEDATSDTVSPSQTEKSKSRTDKSQSWRAKAHSFASPSTAAVSVAA